MMSSVIGHGQNILTPIYAQEYVQTNDKAMKNHKHSFLRIHRSFMASRVKIDSIWIRNIYATLSTIHSFHVWKNVLTALKTHVDTL